MALADVPGAVWRSLREREVVVEKADGSEGRGKLIGVEEAKVAVARPDGAVILVERRSVTSVRMSREAPPPPPALAPAARSAPGPIDPGSFEEVRARLRLVRPAQVASFLEQSPG